MTCQRRAPEKPEKSAIDLLSVFRDDGRVSEVSHLLRFSGMSQGLSSVGTACKAGNRRRQEGQGRKEGGIGSRGRRGGEKKQKEEK